MAKPIESTNRFHGMRKFQTILKKYLTIGIILLHWAVRPADHSFGCTHQQVDYDIQIEFQQLVSLIHDGNANLQTVFKPHVIVSFNAFSNRLEF